MIPDSHAVVGIDVGGEKKGFHAAALRNGAFEDPFRSVDPAHIVEWCRERRASVVAVDAPCGWSQAGSSRDAERKLAREGIHCFATPTKARALKNGFYDWVFNGAKLYAELKKNGYRLFAGEHREGPVCFETFPHAIVCALAGRVIPAKPKKIRRLEVLKEQNYEVGLLRNNIDFIDAALCAVAAEEFLMRRSTQFGTSVEGIIVVPDLAVRAA